MAVVAAMPKSSGADITQVLSIDKAAISRTVRTLVERDLLAVERKSTNLQAIALSQRGEALHRQAPATAFEREKCLLLDLSSADRSQVHDLLARMSHRMPSVFALAETPIGSIALSAGAPNGSSAPHDEPAHEVAALRDRIDRLQSLLADVMLENAAMRAKGGEGSR